MVLGFDILLVLLAYMMEVFLQMGIGIWEQRGLCDRFWVTVILLLGLYLWTSLLHQILIAFSVSFAFSVLIVIYIKSIFWCKHVVLAVKSPPANAGDTRDVGLIKSLSREDPLEEGLTSILAWRIPLTEEPGRSQSIGSKRVGHNWSSLACTDARHINFNSCASWQ